MECEYRIYVVSGNDHVDEEFTSEDIMDLAIDIITAETLEQMLGFLIKSLNDGTLSDENYYFLFQKDDYMTILSDIPNGFVEFEEPEKPDGHW